MTFKVHSISHLYLAFGYCELNFVIFYSRKEEFFPTKSGYLARVHGMNLFFKTLNKLLALTNLEYPILSAKHCTYSPLYLSMFFTYFNPSR